MPHRITDECTSCGKCEPYCPLDAIYEGSYKYEIDASICNDCEGLAKNPQCKKYCPVDGAIVRIEE
ncbi:MAG: 4Fe-4S binding protein [bacterium]|nr:4Fe-4S binding protein [bacterium]